MADMPKYTGLCETCEHDATCMLRRSSQLEIIQCEEFSIQPVIDNRVPVQTQELEADPEEVARMGLCVNCLNVAHCGFPNARQNVQQCEEYILDESGVIPPVKKEYSRSAA